MQIMRFYTSIHFKLQWMSCGRSSSVLNSRRSRCKLAERTVIRVRICLEQHTEPSNTTLMTQRQEILIREGGDNNWVSFRINNLISFTNKLRLLSLYVYIPTCGCMVHQRRKMSGCLFACRLQLRSKLIIDFFGEVIIS